MTWTNNRKKPAQEDNIFEMPTGGAAIMKQGPNLVYFARKEQCLALGKQLRKRLKLMIIEFLDCYPAVKFNLSIQKMGYSSKR